AARVASYDGLGRDVLPKIPDQVIERDDQFKKGRKQLYHPLLVQGIFWADAEFAQQFRRKFESRGWHYEQAERLQFLGKHRLSLAGKFAKTRDQLVSDLLRTLLDLFDRGRFEVRRIDSFGPWESLHQGAEILGAAAR